MEMCRCLWEIMFDITQAHWHSGNILNHPSVLTDTRREGERERERERENVHQGTVFLADGTTAQHNTLYSQENAKVCSDLSLLVCLSLSPPAPLHCTAPTIALIH